VQPFGNGH